MLGDPTCVDTDVSYDGSLCTEESADPCEGLEGKRLKLCKKKEKKRKGGNRREVKKGGKGGKKGHKAKGGKERI